MNHKLDELIMELENRNIDIAVIAETKKKKKIWERLEEQNIRLLLDVTQNFEIEIKVLSYTCTCFGIQINYSSEL
jgi:hypothetical protein